MTDFLIKFVLCSGFFIIVYKAIYEGAKLFQFQRFYLLFSLILCLALPFIPMNKGLFGNLFSSPNKAIENVAPEFTGEIIYLEGNLETSNSLNTETILLIIYSIVTLFLMIRFSISLFKLLRQIHQAEQRKGDGFSIALVEESIQPQSFFNYLLLNKTDFEQSGLPQEILTHEQCHIREKHSIDILLIQLLLVFFWFNPFLYLYRNALRQNHEFLADETVIQSTDNKANYQHLLLNYLQTHQANAFTSAIQFSNLKKRMIMMNKKQSHQIKMVLVALVLPILAFSVYAFTSEKPEVKSPLNEIDNVQIEPNNNLFETITDTIPPPPPPPPPPGEVENAPPPPPPPRPDFDALFNSKNTKFTINGKKVSIEEAQKLRNTKQPGLSYGIDNNPEGTTVHMKTNNYPPPPPLHPDVFDNKSNKFFVDGEEVSAEEAREIDMNTIKSINVNKHDGKGAVYIYTKGNNIPPPPPPIDAFSLKAAKFIVDGKEITWEQAQAYKTNGYANIYVDKSTVNIFTKAFQDYTKEEIQNMRRNGGAPPPPPPPPYKDGVFNDKSNKFFVDRVEVTAEIAKNIDPNTIKSINVNKQDGKGAVYIYTKGNNTPPPPPAPETTEKSNKKLSYQTITGSSVPNKMNDILNDDNNAVYFLDNEQIRREKAKELSQTVPSFSEIKEEGKQTIIFLFSKDNSKKNSGIVNGVLKQKGMSTYPPPPPPPPVPGS